MQIYVSKNKGVSSKNKNSSKNAFDYSTTFQTVKTVRMLHFFMAVPIFLFHSHLVQISNSD